MNLNSIETLITSTLTDFGASVLVILTAVIGLAIAYVAFRFGWNQIHNKAVGKFSGSHETGFTFSGKNASGQFVKNQKVPF